MKSPKKWRDTLVNFKKRRQIINNERKLTVNEKEMIYNGIQMS